MPVPETQVAAGKSIPGDALDPWYFNTVAALMLQQVKTEDEDEEMVAAPGVGNLFNPDSMLVARSGVPLYTFLDVAGRSASPPAVALPLPGASSARTPAPQRLQP